MGRFLSFVLLLAIAAAVNPDLRSRAAPHVAWMLDPVYEWSARSRVQEIGRSLGAEAAHGAHVLTEPGLEAFLRSRFPGETASLDPWGRPYYLLRTRHEVRVGSAGRDRARNTADDILSNAIRLQP